MFRVAFEGDRQEVLPLIEFLQFLYAEDVRSRLMDHPLGPSQVWKGWADETYVGFSTGRLMLQSGHRFGPAEITERPSRLPWRRNKFDISRDRRVFDGFYPDYRMPPVHEALYSAHPSAYLRAAEAVMLSGTTPNRMIEVGAGNAVHVAFRHLLDPDMKIVVIDLPESICVGYLLLRTMGVDVALPHEDRDAPVITRLPFQDISGSFDFAFNMSSFQEMALDTVNRYLRAVHALLDGDGRLQHINLYRSKQFPENRPEAYDMSGFVIDGNRDVPYHSALDRRNPVGCFLARKARDRAR